MGDQSEVQVNKRKTKIRYDQDATSTPIFHLTTPTLKIFLMTTKNSNIGRGSIGNLATGREPVPADEPNY
jgi:hypothetical protein